MGSLLNLCNDIWNDILYLVPIDEWSKIESIKTSALNFNDFVNKDVLSIIFKKIYRKDLLNCRLVSKSWNNASLRLITYLKNINNDNQLEIFIYLRTLDLTGNNTITDDGLKHLKQLRTLDLTGNKTITDDGLKHLKQLRTLNITGNKMITDDGLKELKYLTNLIN